MQTKFKPMANRFLFNIAIHNKEFREKLFKTPIRNYVLPKKNELFSSWLSRVATINFLQTTTFINHYFKEYKNWFTNRDLDILLDTDIAQNFAQRMNIDTNTIFNTSLKTYHGYLSENITDKTRNRLISAIKRKGTYNRLYGLKYCPHCLKEENYFKKEWRLSFYNICLKHKTIMLDRCPECGEPLTITKRKYDLKEFNCWNCGFKFENAHTETLNLNSKALIMLEKAMDILNKGWFKFDNKPYYSIAYFKIVKQLIKLIFNKGYRENYTLNKELEYLDVKLPSLELSKGKYIEEFMSIKESIALFTAIFDILSNSDKLNRFIKDNKILIYTLKSDMNYIPYFYDEIIWQFYKQQYTPTYYEVKSAVKWMKKNNILVNWTSISNLFGVYLDKRKRPELIELIQGD